MNNYLYLYNKPYCRHIYPFEINKKMYVYFPVLKSAHSETINRLNKILGLKPQINNTCLFYKKKKYEIDFIKKAYLLTFVRNPITHLLSGFEEIDDYYTRRPDRLYQERKKSSNHGYIKLKGIEKNYSVLFEAMYNDVLESKENHKTRYNEMLWHIIPQFVGLKNSKNHINLNFIGKIEEYEKDWNFFLKIANISTPITTSHNNPSSLRRHRKQINENIFLKNKKLTSSICSFLKPDYIYFNYKIPYYCNF